MAIQAFAENWRPLRDWREEQIKGMHFDDGGLEAADRALLSSTHKWRNPSRKQLNYLGSVASRVLGASEEWNEEDLHQELGRRKRSAKLKRAQEQQAAEAVGKVNLIGKWKLFGLDMIEYRGRLSQADFLVLRWLYDRTYADKGEARGSIAEASAENRLDRATVCRSLNKLEKLGLYECDRDGNSKKRSSGGRNRRNTFRGVIQLAIERHPELGQPANTAKKDRGPRDSLRHGSVASHATVSASKVSRQTRHAGLPSSTDPYKLDHSTRVRDAHWRVDVNSSNSLDEGQRAGQPLRPRPGEAASPPQSRSRYRGIVTDDKGRRVGLLRSGGIELIIEPDPDPDL